MGTVRLPLEPLQVELLGIICCMCDARMRKERRVAGYEGQAKDAIGILEYSVQRAGETNIYRSHLLCVEHVETPLWYPFE